MNVVNCRYDEMHDITSFGWKFIPYGKILDIFLSLSLLSEQKTAASTIFIGMVVMPLPDWTRNFST